VGLSSSSGGASLGFQIGAAIRRKIASWNVNRLAEILSAPTR